MDWNQEALMAMRVLLAVLLGGFVGWERERHGREAGIRTYAAVSLGSCVFALLSTHVVPKDNPHVLAAGVVTGIGFLCAGVIMQDKGNVLGLTTAATLWAMAAVGMAVGYGMYTLSILVSFLIFGLLSLHHLPGWDKLKRIDASPGTDPRGEDNHEQG